MPTPPTGPIPQQPPEPLKPPSGEGKPLTPLSDSKDAYLLKSPFAKMFRATGAEPTAKQIRAIINGILQQQIQAIKKQDESWKKAMRKLKREIEGNE